MLRHLLDEIIKASAQHDGGITDGMAREIERQFRNEYGGDEVYIQKNAELAQKKQKALDEAMQTGKPLEAAKSNGISRSTMYRLLNRRR